MKPSNKAYILKFGSKALLTGEVDLERTIERIAKEVHRLRDTGVFCVIVTSGAKLVGQTSFEKGIKCNSERRFFSAIGQSKIIDLYRNAFSKINKNIEVAQFLLSREALADRKTYSAISQCLEDCKKHGIIPIINNNDLSFNDRLDFVDNDQLATYIAIMMKADHLFLFSDVDGIFTKNPKVYPDAIKIDGSTHDLSDLENIRQDKGDISNGGIGSKIDAIELSYAFGISVSVGRFENLVNVTLNEVSFGTSFTVNNKKNKIKGYRRWLKAGAVSKGIIIASDKGSNAIAAIGERKSLLHKGIVGVFGEFLAGDVVTIRSESFKTVGIGKSNFSSYELSYSLINSSVKTSKTHGDAVISADQIISHNRDYFENQDSIFLKKVEKYYKKKQISISSNSDFSVEVFKKGNNHPKGPKVLVAKLCSGLTDEQRDELRNQKNNLHLDSWQNFWTLKYYLQEFTNEGLFEEIT